jgi:hypothetical protein
MNVTCYLGQYLFCFTFQIVSISAAIRRVFDNFVPNKNSKQLLAFSRFALSLFSPVALTYVLHLDHFIGNGEYFCELCDGTTRKSKINLLKHVKALHRPIFNRLVLHMQNKHTFAVTLTLIDVHNSLTECDGVLILHMHPAR